MIAGVAARYWWQGALCSDSEALVVMETATSRVAAAMQRIAALHPYSVPKILAFAPIAFLVLVGLAQRNDVADPVPQAMVLTGIVVSVAATALALAMTRKYHALTGRLELPEDGDV